MNKFILLIMLLISASCGYIGEDPIDNSSYTSDATTTCKTDPGAMATFMTEILTEPIDCLETNLEKYAEAVERTNRNYIDKDDLEKFVNKFFKEEHIQKTLDSMDLFYQLIRLVLQDDQGRLLISNIPRIIEVLRTANIEFVAINNILDTAEENKAKGNIWLEREKLVHSLNNLSNSILELVENSPGHKQALKALKFADIDLSSLLRNINKKLGSDKKLEDGVIDIITIAKELLLGGDRDQISTIEATALLRKVPELGEIVFDILYADDEVIADYPNQTIAENGLAALYLKRIRELRKFITWDNYNKTIITTDDIITIVETLIDTSDYNVNNFRVCIEKAKQILLQGDSDRVSLQDIDTLINEATDLMATIYFNSVTYDHYDYLMSQNIKLNSIPGLASLQLPAYRGMFNSTARLNTAKKEFEDIATVLRLYRNEDNGQYYKKDIIRTKYGFNETAAVRFLATKLLRHFGSMVIGPTQQASKYEPIVHRSEYVVNTDELFQALLSFKPLLQELDLWTLHPDTYAANTLLMADLFQVGSDADDTINVVEATQYIELILTTMGMSSDFLDGFETSTDQNGHLLCENLTPDEEDASYEVDCYRKYVFQFIVDINKPCENQELSNLCKYAKEASDEEKIQFLYNVESFAREKGYVEDNVPMQNRDLILVLGTILNIESMIVRFDLNKNNYLDVDEVNATFDLYQNTIIRKAKLTGVKKKFAKSAYLYMVSNMDLPSTLPLLWYHFTDKKEVEATRKNVGALFWYFGNF